MSSTARIIDLAKLAEYGLDDNVERIDNPHDTSLEQYQTRTTPLGTKVVFGEYVDRSEGGWDLGRYENVADPTDEPVWRMVGAPDYFEAPDELLAAVAEWLRQELAAR